jgi:orotidine-5'-phosphate decarboxylase
MRVAQRLHRAWELNGSLLCVGLDSEEGKLPLAVRRKPHPQYVFNTSIIDQTHEYVCAYKLNTAFYEGRGTEGITDLKLTCDYIKRSYPDIFLVIDAKRGDIGNTNTGYVSFVFDYLGADAVTVQPYLGGEALKPFLERSDKASIILCRTSNAGSSELQDLEIGGRPLYQNIAERVASSWNANNNCMLVVGATYPDELACVRRIAGDMPLLVPGIGVQGGDLAKTIASGVDTHGTGMIINSSRGIIFADNPGVSAETLHLEIDSLRKKHERSSHEDG